jgi:hypothetical protein
MAIFEHPRTCTRALVDTPGRVRGAVAAETAATRHLLASGARWLARLGWLREVLLLGLWYEGYELARRFTPTHPRLALAHAHGVISFERHLHIGVERSLNEVFARDGWLGAAAGYWYALAHFGVTVGVLVWLYLRRPNLYRSARTILVLASVMAIVVFYLYPVAPPRLAEAGLVDTNVVHNIFGVAHAEKSGGFVNIYAAIPSLHAGWAIWVAATMSKAFPRNRARFLLWLYPTVTILVVLGTANHYLVDVISGGAAVGLAALIVRVVRPELIRNQGADQPGWLAAPAGWARTGAEVAAAVGLPRIPSRGFPAASNGWSRTARRRPSGGPRSTALLLASGARRRAGGGRS